jgi:hypothetical protein
MVSGVDGTGKEEGWRYILEDSCGIVTSRETRIRVKTINSGYFTLYHLTYNHHSAFASSLPFYF